MYACMRPDFRVHACMHVFLLNPIRVHQIYDIYIYTCIHIYRYIHKYLYICRYTQTYTCIQREMCMWTAHSQSRYTYKYMHMCTHISDAAAAFRRDSPPQGLCPGSCRKNHFCGHGTSFPCGNGGKGHRPRHRHPCPHQHRHAHGRAVHGGSPLSQPPPRSGRRTSTQWGQSRQ